MNEELKIIISAVTDKARKNIQGVKNELGGLSKEGSKAGGGIAKGLKVAGVAAAAVVGTIAAVGAALVALSNNTKQFREEQARLNAAFLAAGSSAEQASQTYSNLFRFLGDSGKASEAAGHLAKLTTNEKELAEWTTALQGVYATFGDSLPIEGLTEAANETAKVGAVTGTLADALNWAGVSEDAFNASLAACNSEAEREKLIRDTLNGLYNDAAQLYEKNNAEIIAQNEAQARLDATTARLGKTTQPLVTALANMSNALLTALAPAIGVVTNALTWLINALSRAIGWVMSFFSALSGKSVDTEAIASVGNSLSSAAGGAGALGSGLADANKQAEKLKRTTAGFDELNVMSSGSSGSSGSNAGATGGGGIGAITGGNAIDTSGITGALDNTSASVEAFVTKIKSAFDRLKVAFAPTIQAFKDFGIQVSGAFTEALPNFQAGIDNFLGGFKTVYGYLLEEFIPNVTNSWSTNILPIFGDVLSFAITELGKSFEWLGGLFNTVTNEVIVPVLQTLETITTDVFDGIKKAWDESGGELLANLSTAFEGIRNTIDTFYKQFLKPVIDTVLGWVNEMWQKHLKPLWDNLVSAVLDIANNLTILWNSVLKPIIDWILQKIYPVVKTVIDNVLMVLDTLIGYVTDVINGIIRVIKGVIAFITGVFTGDWKKAWNGVKDIVGGAWDMMWAGIKATINLIIDGLNMLWKSVYKVFSGIANGIGSAVGWIGELMGKDWEFSLPSKPPLIPKLATGGIVNSATVAMIGERGKEAVLPLENNTEWMDKLADRLAAKINAPSKIVLMLNETELGWANINSINGITEQTGQLQLNLV